MQPVELGPRIDMAHTDVQDPPELCSSADPDPGVQWSESTAALHHSCELSRNTNLMLASISKRVRSPKALTLWQSTSQQSPVAIA